METGTRPRRDQGVKKPGFDRVAFALFTIASPDEPALGLTRAIAYFAMSQVRGQAA